MKKLVIALALVVFVGSYALPVAVSANSIKSEVINRDDDPKKKEAKKSDVESADKKDESEIIKEKQAKDKKSKPKEKAKAKPKTVTSKKSSSKVKDNNRKSEK